MVTAAPQRAQRPARSDAALLHEPAALSEVWARSWAGFVDRVGMYLPVSWIEDRARCQRAGVPESVTFATKPQLALQMVQRALEAGVPAAWVVGDEVYGDDSKLRRWLEAREQPYVVAVSSQHRIWSEWRQIPVRELLQQVPADGWHCLSAGDGAKGPRTYDWAFARFPEAKSSRWQRGILFRRSLAGPTDVAYYAVFAAKTTPLAEVVRAAGSRWSIEECFESAKGEVGLDHYEVRSFTGWYRHITLALFAHAFLTVQRAASEAPAGKKIRRAQAVGRADRAHHPRGAPPALGAAVGRAG